MLPVCTDRSLVAGISVGRSGELLHDWRDEFAGEAACAGMLQENDIQLVPSGERGDR